MKLNNCINKLVYPKYIALIILLISVLYTNISHAQVKDDLPYKSQLIEVENKLKEGNIAESIRILNEITDEYPEAADVYYAKAIIYGQFRNIPNAIENATIAYQKDDKIMYAHYLVDLYKVQNDYGAAIDIVKSIQAKMPHLESINRELLLLYAQSNQMPLAEKLYENIAKKSHSDTLDVVMAEIYLNKNNYAQAKKLLIPLDGKTSISDAYGYLGFIYTKEGKYKESIGVIERGLKHTNDKSLYLDMADSYKAQNKGEAMFLALKNAFQSSSTSFDDKFRVVSTLMYDESKLVTDTKLIQLADMLVLNHPDVLDAQVLRGELLWRNGSLEDARSVFLKVVSSNLKYLNAWRLLINVDIALHQYDEAIKHSKEALIHNPNNPQVLFFASLAYSANEEYQQSKDFLELALNYSENENNFLKSTIYGGLGDVYHVLNMFDLSDAAYEEAISLDSTNISALNNYAYYLAIRKKDLDKAAKYSKMSLELEPTTSNYMDTYAWVLFQKGEFAQALEWIEKAIKYNTNSPVVYEHYGDILSKLGKSKEAVKYWEKAIEILISQNSSQNTDLIHKKIKEKRYVE